ncbi:MAG: hypothetical protein FJ255_09395 [Phycisphaerae bacterium]|nr:hypothetical protein [Phycisphaerae bacterium]
MTIETLASLGSALGSVPAIAIVLGCTVGLVSIIAGAATRHARTKEREQSRREIAAYVAEGSITPEYGERLMAAGESPRKSGCCG